MSTLYLCEDGSRVNKNGERLIVTREKEVLLDMPIHKLTQVFVFGNVQLTTQAMSVLLDEEIDVAFFSSHGRFKGSLGGAMSKNIPLRLAQYQSWADPEFRLRMGQTLIEAKLNNMRQLMRLYRYNHSEVDSNAAISAIQEGLKHLPSASCGESIMGIEGYCTREYFKALGSMFRGDLNFTGRQKHPAPDPINALLSLGYTLVGNEIGSLLEAMSLDPYLGYLHGVKYGRKSLALDLLEEFRQAIVDPYTLRLVNLRIFAPDDFEDSEEGKHLTKLAFKRYIQHYEERMDNASQPWRGEKIGWRKIIALQVEELRMAVMEMRPYRPYYENMKGEE